MTLDWDMFRSHRTYRIKKLVTFPSDPYKNTLKENASLNIHPSRRIPQCMHQKLKLILKLLEKGG